MDGAARGIFVNDSPEAQKAEQIYAGFRDKFERLYPNQVVAIDLETEKPFVGKDVLEAVTQARAASASEPTVIMVKQIGGAYPLAWGKHVVSIDAEKFLRDFQNGRAVAYTVCSKGALKKPCMFRKLSNAKRAVVLWMSREAAEASPLCKSQPPEIREATEVREFTMQDLRNFLKAGGPGADQNLAIEVMG